MFRATMQPMNQYADRGRTHALLRAIHGNEARKASIRPTVTAYMLEFGQQSAYVHVDVPFTVTTYLLESESERDPWRDRMHVPKAVHGRVNRIYHVPTVDAYVGSYRVRMHARMLLARFYRMFGTPIPAIDDYRLAQVSAYRIHDGTEYAEGSAFEYRTIRKASRKATLALYLAPTEMTGREFSKAAIRRNLLSHSENPHE